MALYSAHTDEALMLLLQSSSDAAFTEMYDRYWKLLFSIAANKLHNLADAEEVVQEVFADLWQRRMVIEIKTSLKSYLAASIKYQVWTLMAKRNKESRQQDQFSVVHIGKWISPAQQLEAKELFYQLQQRTASLPEKCRLVYTLSRDEGLSNKEIAATLQVTEKAVEGHITRALRHVKAGVELIIFLFFFLF